MRRCGEEVWSSDTRSSYATSTPSNARIRVDELSWTFICTTVRHIWLAPDRRHPHRPMRIEVRASQPCVASSSDMSDRTSRPNRRRVGRPPAGARDGEKVKDYPQLSIRVPLEFKARLNALSAVTGLAQWRVIIEAINCFL